QRSGGAGNEAAQSEDRGAGEGRIGKGREERRQARDAARQGFHQQGVVWLAVRALIPPPSRCGNRADQTREKRAMRAAEAPAGAGQFLRRGMLALLAFIAMA